MKRGMKSGTREKFNEFIIPIADKRTIATEKKRSITVRTKHRNSIKILNK